MQDKTKIVKVKKNPHGEITDVMMENGNVYSINDAKELLDPEKGAVKKAVQDGKMARWQDGKIKEITDLENKTDIVNATFGFGIEEEKEI